MKIKPVIFSLLLVGILTLVGCMPGDPLPESFYTSDVYPGTTGTYDLGSADLKYDDIWCVTGHFDAHSMYLGDTLLTEELLIALLEGGSPESGGGDMYKSVYDPNEDDLIAELQLLLDYSTHDGTAQDTTIAIAIDHSESAHAPYDAQKNSDIIKAEVEAVLTGEIITHTHPGNGSSGPVIKSGTITTDGSGSGAVSFTTAFPDTNYAISLTADAIGIDAVIAIYGSKTAIGFLVETRDDGGKSEGNIAVDWLAVEHSNP